MTLTALFLLNSQLTKMIRIWCSGSWHTDTLQLIGPLPCIVNKLILLETENVGSIIPNKFKNPQLSILMGESPIGDNTMMMK
jgi:hypothetical protein